MRAESRWHYLCDDCGILFMFKDTAENHKKIRGHNRIVKGRWTPVSEGKP